MIKDKNHYAVIMAGGVGSRFWPSSRAHLPKQFLDILGVGKSLLQLTYERFARQFDQDNIFIVTNQNYVEIVKSQIPGIKDSCVLGEPSMKNTAACIAYAVSLIHKINTHALCVVAPSDHLILDESKFLEEVTKAMGYARQNNGLITLGIRPSRPDTGYGYIQYHHTDDYSKHEIFKVKTFTEKPTLEIAQTFIESGDFLWNAGIFVWSVSAIKQAFKQYMPDHYSLFKEGSKSYFTPNERTAIQQIYEQCRSVSIDYGVMEKADNVYVIPVDFGWSDLGTWASLYENCTKDENNNVAKGKQILLFETHESLITNTQKDKLTVVNGVSNLIVVDTPDVLLICDKSREQEVKQIVTEIKLKFEDKFI
jgi:mannose-1-phosphate guanylyltransferase